MLQKTETLDLEDCENPEVYDIINRAQMQEREGILICVNNYLKIFKEFITVFSTIIDNIKF